MGISLHRTGTKDWQKELAVDFSRCKQLLACKYKQIAILLEGENTDRHKRSQKAWDGYFWGSFHARQWNTMKMKWSCTLLVLFPVLCGLSSCTLNLHCQRVDISRGKPAHIGKSTRYKITIVHVFSPFFRISVALPSMWQGRQLMVQPKDDLMCDRRLAKQCQPLVWCLTCNCVIMLQGSDHNLPWEIVGMNGHAQQRLCTDAFPWRCPGLTSGIHSEITEGLETPGIVWSPFKMHIEQMKYKTEEAEVLQHAQQQIFTFWGEKTLDVYLT